jgi:hypothetical protein
MILDCCRIKDRDIGEVSGLQVAAIQLGFIPRRTLL